MSIEEAKNELEKEIILWDGVIGIGIINENNILMIEVSIAKDNKAISEKLNRLITDNHWQEYIVKIVPADGFKFH